MKFTLVIRFTDTSTSAQQVRDLEIPLSINFDKDDVNRLVSIKWIKNTIRSKVSQCSSNRLRLIYSGRVLNEKTDFRKEIFEPRLRYLHSEANQSGAGSPTPDATEDRIYIHCVIGETLTREQLAAENQLDNTPQAVSTTPNVIGFDRLLQQGFSQEDIDEMRRQFMLYDSNTASSSGRNDLINDVEEEERNQRAIRLREEMWIESTVNGNSGTQAIGAAGGNDGGSLAAQQQVPAQPSADLDDTNGNEDLLLGLLLGIFLGVISIIFLVADDTVFNKRLRMSLIAGIFINFSFAIIRGQWI
ncbi:DUF2407 C-terminal domain-containing protein [Scheffersomyces xylosifermentans]|uniref:DUF2407 C-terminal domain-containing protein n=1 Tax=Scheffersomyces xylosifermentans TaxID=1304137 RepID=UPI00315C90E8